MLGERFGLTGAVWDFTRSVDLNLVGYAVVALFVMTWAVALAVWRLARIEERLALPADPA